MSTRAQRKARRRAQQDRTESWRRTLACAYGAHDFQVEYDIKLRPRKRCRRCGAEYAG